MTERVTVEQNGERFTLDVPDGTSDADIQKFIASQSGTGAGLAKTAEPTGQENAATYGTQAAAKTAQNYLESTNGGLISDAARVLGKLYNNVTPEIAGEFLAHPVRYAQEGIKAYAAGLPMAKMPLSEIAPAAARSVGNSFAAPENAFTLPYNLAAYEQARIRANPTAPEYKNNPYAMQQRGQAPTQAAAGAMNQRTAVAGMNTAGNPAPGTPEFAALQQQYAPPQPPSSANFIQRMHQLADQYLPYKQ